MAPEPSFFLDKSSPPDDDALAEALGRGHGRWTKLVAMIAARFEPLTEEWNFPGKKYGWSLRLKRKKRAVLYLIPLRRKFDVGLVLGDRAVRAAHDAGLDRELLEMLDAAKKYPEGRGVRFEVKNQGDLRSVLRLAEVKMAN